MSCLGNAFITNLESKLRDFFKINFIYVLKTVDLELEKLSITLFLMY